MPFTASHPAAVLVIAAPLARWGLPVPALVIGSVAPDIFTMLPIPSLVHFAHTPLGLVTADLAIGVAAFYAWQVFYGPAVIAIAPKAWPARLPRSGHLPGNSPLEHGSDGLLPGKLRDLGKVVVAVLLGAATHLMWDSFTHDWMWGAQHIAWLAERHGPLLGWQWVQKVSDVVGLVVVACWVVVSYRRAPRTLARHQLLAVSASLGPAAITFCVLLLRDSFYVAITTAAAIGVIGLTVLAVVRMLKP